MNNIFLVLISIITLTAFKKNDPKMNQKEEIVSILQTADIDAYLNPHTELFLKNGEIEYREAGGLAHIKTLVEKVRENNPDGTIFLDGGDLIQGSGESMLSQGHIFPSLIRAMNYDLLIPLQCAEL